MQGPKRAKLAEKLLNFESDLDYIKKSDAYYSISRRKRLDGGRVVVWFSCGATSAVAAKLAVHKYAGKRPVHVVYCDTHGEHPSNKKFLQDVQEWIGQEIEVLENPFYRDHFDVFEKRKYLLGPHGAQCTTLLKKDLRKAYQEVHSDIQIFGFSLEEIARAETFRMNNLDVYLETILIDKGLDKGDCLRILVESGIELPHLYLPQKSGSPYKSNNCVGCVKGGAWYWNKIKIDFPDAFDRMVAIEQKLNATCVRYNKKRVFLKDLPPDAGRPGEEPNMECGILCVSTLEELECWDK